TVPECCCKPPKFAFFTCLRPRRCAARPTMTAHVTQPSAIVHKRSTSMLRSALGSAITAWLDDSGVAEVMLNADGRLWVDRLDSGMIVTDERLSPTQAERIIRLVAHHVGSEVHRAT